jgi:hypothetical protein
MIVAGSKIRDRGFGSEAYLNLNILDINGNVIFN